MIERLIRWLVLHSWARSDEKEWRDKSEAAVRALVSGRMDQVEYQSVMEQLAHRYPLARSIKK